MGLVLSPSAGSLPDGRKPKAEECPSQVLSQKPTVSPLPLERQCCYLRAGIGLKKTEKVIGTNRHSWPIARSQGAEWPGVIITAGTTY